MKDYKFYLEYPDAKSKRKATRANLGNHSGNVVAIYQPTRIEQWRATKSYECACGIFEEPNSSVSWGQVSPEYLNERCKLIPEKQARTIHEKLFNYLEQ